MRLRTLVVGLIAVGAGAGASPASAAELLSTDVTAGGVGVHQPVDRAGILDPDLDHPPLTVGILVHAFGMVVQTVRSRKGGPR